MPPNSHSLVEEGAAILSFKLVKAGVFQVHLLPALAGIQGYNPQCSWKVNHARLR